MTKPIVISVRGEPQGVVVPNGGEVDLEASAEAGSAVVRITELVRL
jgi:hypothetical protein